jgi:hypothetical protein
MKISIAHHLQGDLHLVLLMVVQMQEQDGFEGGA